MGGGPGVEIPYKPTEPHFSCLCAEEQGVAAGAELSSPAKREFLCQCTSVVVDYKREYRCGGPQQHARPRLGFGMSRRSSRVRVRASVDFRLFLKK